MKKPTIVYVYKFWACLCGYCGKETLRAVNSNHMIVCSRCGH